MTQVLKDCELLYNIMQWYSTVVVDCRPESTHRLRGSVVRPSMDFIRTMPFKDDAICVECPGDDCLYLSVLSLTALLAAISHYTNLHAFLFWTCSSLSMHPLSF